MIAKLKRHLREYPFIMKIAKKVYRQVEVILNIPIDYKLAQENIMRIDQYNRTSQNNIYYFCVPTHANLGDQAQTYCIRRWINNYYPNSNIVELNSKPVAFNKKSIVDKLKTTIKRDDLIVVQSGYCTTDLHGVDEIVHRIILKSFPNNLIIIFPQTIKFNNEMEKNITAKVYNEHNHTIFMARDVMSYTTAQEMFNKNVKLILYPDIVTSLIGKIHYQNSRNNILFCMRNDGETYYKNSEIKALRNKIEKITGKTTDLTDTSINMKHKEIKEKIETVIMENINAFSKYKLIITDRYHGTIFALIAGTPVIVLKTNDHKVSSGVDWFKDIYQDYIRLAQSLDDVIPVAQQLLKIERNYKLDEYFDKQYYAPLKEIIDRESNNAR